MLEQTHARIATEIAKALGVEDKRKVGLMWVGSKSPDSWATFPHHEGKESEIIENILNARLLFLEGDDECFHKLGIALHYIQDGWTLRPRMQDKHTKWERQIEKNPILDDCQLEDGINNSYMPTKDVETYLRFLEKLKYGIAGIADYYKENLPKEENSSWGNKELYWGEFGLHVLITAIVPRPTMWSTPFLDINFAYRISLLVAQAVLTTEKTSKEEETEKRIVRLKKQLHNLQKKLGSFPYSYYEKSWQYHKLGETAKTYELEDSIDPLDPNYMTLKVLKKIHFFSPSKKTFRVTLAPQGFIEFESEILAALTLDILKMRDKISKSELLTLKIPSEKCAKEIMDRFQLDRNQSEELRKAIEELQKQSEVWWNKERLKEIVASYQARIREAEALKLHRTLQEDFHIRSDRIIRLP